MKIELVEHTVRELVDGYRDSQEEGVVGFGGKLDIRPAYQREFVYNDEQRNAVIYSIIKGFPLNSMYWMVDGDGNYELLDGQQRTLSICQFCAGVYSILVNGRPKTFFNLTQAEKDIILNYKLMIYVCEGTDTERLDWFRVINTGGEKLYEQEMRNAVYSGPWVHDAKRYFSKRSCPASVIASDYLSGKMIRQDYLETAISWIAATKGQSIDEYMADHQHDTSASELWLYFRGVITWIETIFTRYRREMKGLKWGELYEKYRDYYYDPQQVDNRVTVLYADPAVHNKKGIFEFVLGGCTNTSLLDVRIFDTPTKATVYERQTQEARKKGVSNCPLCALGNGGNRKRIYDLSEMDADHVTAWTRGGSTDISNCQMLCQMHNRSVGNK